MVSAFIAENTFQHKNLFAKIVHMAGKACPWGVTHN